MKCRLKYVPTIFQIDNDVQIQREHGKGSHSQAIKSTQKMSTWYVHNLTPEDTQDKKGAVRRKVRGQIKWTNKDNMVLHSGNNRIGVLHMHMYSKLLKHLPAKQITPEKSQWRRIWRNEQENHSNCMERRKVRGQIKCMNMHA